MIERRRIGVQATEVANTALVACPITVAGMRRLAVVVLASAWFIVGGAQPAGAHVCPVTTELPVNQQGTVTVAVVVEGTPIPDVEMEVPAALRLEGVDPPKGWTAHPSGQSARLNGPAFAPFTCEYFSIAVTPTTKGAFGIRIVQRDAHGVVRGDSMPDPVPPNPTFVTTVYAGVKPPAPPNSGGGLSVVTIAGIALIGLGAIAVAVLVWRSRRDRRIDDRVEEFKKQVRDRGA